MIKQEKINGIRLTKNFIQLGQKGVVPQSQIDQALYKRMENNRINMVFMSLNTIGDEGFISGTIAAKHFGQMAQKGVGKGSHLAVSTVSIYPHHYRLQLLGRLLSLLGDKTMPFLHLVSSNAMLTFVVEQHQCDAFVKMISENFDLPSSHVPFEQTENEELTQFLKKKYPETRATYVEQKIKTYGIELVADLNLSEYGVPFEDLCRYGQKMGAMEGKFCHASAHMATPGILSLFLLTERLVDIPAVQVRRADLVRFHGPHFGDRHSIISRALNCLSQHAIPVLQADCTGASVCLVLPHKKGKTAQQALLDVFEIP